jgi:hypothetical protein
LLQDDRGKAECPALALAVVFGVEEEGRVLLAAVVRVGVLVRDTVDAVEEPVRVDGSVVGRWVPVLDPELVLVAAVCDEADDDAVDVRVPLVRLVELEVRSLVEPTRPWLAVT